MRHKTQTNPNSIVDVAMKASCACGELTIAGLPSVVLGTVADHRMRCPGPVKIDDNVKPDAA